MILWLSPLTRVLFRFVIDETYWAGFTVLLPLFSYGIFHSGLTPLRGFLCLSEVSEQRCWFLEVCGKDRQSVVMGDGGVLYLPALCR